MTREERRTVTITAAALLLASLARFAWETRPAPPLFPPEPVPAELLEETRLELEREERMRTPLAPGERVDPNRDPDVELARLPGIGPALARRIVEDRESRGPFRTPEELLRVAGIGPATLSRVEPLIDLGDPASVPAPGAGPQGRVTTGPSTGLPASPSGGSGTVDLNRADAAELQRLPGIGPALAERILEHRSRRGGFGSVEELLEVPGIGPATLERLRPLVRAGME